MRPGDGLTLLLITDEVMLRADLVPSQPLALHRALRPPAALGAAAIALALELSPLRASPRTWVLDARPPCRVVELPAAACQGLDAASLAGALAFELQALGEEADELAFCPLKQGSAEGIAPFLVLTTTTTELAAIIAAVSSHGGRLCGLAHPAALPAPLVPVGAGSAWSRVERWPTCILRLTGSDGDAVAITVHDARSIPSDVPIMPPAFGDDALIAWATAWCSHLQRGGLPPLCLQQPPRPLSWPIIALVAVLALALVGGWLQWLRLQDARLVTGLRQQATAARLAQAGFEADATAVEALRGEVEQARTALATALARTAALDRLRHVPVVLLTALASRPDPATTISGVSLDLASGRVTGVTSDRTSVDGLARHLRQRLGSEGWQVAAPDVQSGSADGSLSFAIAVMPPAGLAQTGSTP